MARINLINCDWKSYTGKSRLNVNPFQPLELCYLSAILRKEGYQTKITDLNLEPSKEITEAEYYIITSSPAYVFWRCAPLTVQVPLTTAQRIKKLYPKSRTVLIGPHGSVDDTLIKNKHIDAVIRGEPEFICSKVLKKMGAGKIISEIGIVERLDELPFPDYDKKTMHKYSAFNFPGKGRPRMPVLYETSRGCPYNCTYCFKTKFRNKYRRKSANKIVKELARLQNEYGVDYVFFIDENATANIKEAKALMRQIIDRKLKIKWSCETGLMYVDKELLKLMQKAGCTGIEYGVESGSEIILKNLNKPQNLDIAARNIQLTIEAGIKPWLFFIVGSPGENFSTIMESVRFLRRIDLSKVRFSADVPYPYPTTKLYETAVLEGKASSNKIDWESMLEIAGTVGNKLSKARVRMYKVLFLAFLAASTPGWSIPYVLRSPIKIAKRVFG
ncbi:MAG: radical SAM protein [Candidatus Woesearchaeota archaeon]